MTVNLAELQELCIKSRLDYADPAGFRQIAQMLCDRFIGIEYGAWADGSTLESLDDFNYTLDTLDCVTFVEVILALCKTNPQVEYPQYLIGFENNLRAIHYADGKPNFISRNHFQCLDWPRNNMHTAEDITQQLYKNFKVAEATINKPNWLQKHIVCKNTLAKYPEGSMPVLNIEVARTPYILTEDLLANRQQVFNDFPDFCLVNIVRPNWDLTQQIGTHLNISHLGLVFKDLKQQDLIFYHASSIPKQVVATSLLEYMQNLIDSPTVRGINVMAVSPGLRYAG